MIFLAVALFIVTPSFPGNWEARVVRGMEHYQEKMRLDSYFLEFTPELLDHRQRKVCALTFRHSELEADRVIFSTHWSCRLTWKPEHIALHEQCHRWKGHTKWILTGIDPEAEAFACEVKWANG